MAFETEFIETVNAPELATAVFDAARGAGLDAVPDRQPMSFSEDFAHFSNAIPGCFALLGNGETGPYAKPLHSNDYDFNDALLPVWVSFWTDLVRQRLPVSSQSNA